MDKVRSVIEKEPEKEAVKNIRNLQIIQSLRLITALRFEIRKLQKNLNTIASGEGIEFVYGKGKRKT